MQNQLSPQTQRALRVLSQVPDDVAAMAVDDVMSGQKSVQPRFYWSTCRFRVTKAGAGPFTYTIDTTTRTFFNYKVGDNLVPAGFAAGATATRAETNLTVAGSTTEDNADVIVWGMGLEVCSNNQQPDLVGELFRQLDLIMSLSSTTKIYLGGPTLYPCPGGLNGLGISKIAQGATNDNQGAETSFLNNGLPAQGNLRKLPTPWRWNSIGSNKKDTALQIAATPANAAVVTGATIPASGLDPIAYPGWTVPAEEAVFVDVRMYLQVIEISDRSDNV